MALWDGILWLHLLAMAKEAEIELTIDDLRRLNEVFPRDAASGQRYPEHMMALVNA